MKPRKLSADQQTQLRLAQHRLETGRWSFQEYSQHLSLYVYNIE